MKGLSLSIASLIAILLIPPVVRAQVGPPMGPITQPPALSSTIYPGTLPAPCQVLQGNLTGTAYAPQTLSGGATVACGGAVTLNVPAATSTTVGGAIPRDDLSIDGSGNLDNISPTDPTIYRADAVLVSGACPGGWNSRGTGTFSSQDSTWPNIGTQTKLLSTASASTFAGCVLGGGNALGALGSNAGWNIQIIFKLVQTANTRFYVGLGVYGDGTPRGTNGMWLRYDTNATYADTDFTFENIYSGGSSTKSDTLVAADTNFHRLQIQSTTAGQIIYTLYSASGVVQAGPTTIGTNAPTTALTAVILMGNDVTGTASSVYWNKYGFRARGLAR